MLAKVFAKRFLQILQLLRQGGLLSSGRLGLSLGGFQLCGHHKALSLRHANVQQLRWPLTRALQHALFRILKSNIHGILRLRGQV